MLNGRSSFSSGSLALTPPGMQASKTRSTITGVSCSRARPHRCFWRLGTELGAGSDTNSNDSAIIQALRHGASDSLNQTGQQVVRRSLNIQPTLTIRLGFPVRVIVNRDLRRALTQDDNLNDEAEDRRRPRRQPVKVTAELPASVHRDLVVR